MAMHESPTAKQDKLVVPYSRRRERERFLEVSWNGVKSILVSEVQSIIKCLHVTHVALGFVSVIYFKMASNGTLVSILLWTFHEWI